MAITDWPEDERPREEDVEPRRPHELPEHLVESKHHPLDGLYVASVRERHLFANDGGDESSHGAAGRSHRGGATSEQAATDIMGWMIP